MPPAIELEEQHCSIVNEGGSCKFVGGKGELCINGKMVGDGEEIPVEAGARVVIAGQLLVYLTTDHLDIEVTAEEVAREYRKVLQNDEIMTLDP